MKRSIHQMDLNLGLRAYYRFSGSANDICEAYSWIRFNFKRDCIVKNGLKAVAPINHPAYKKMYI